MICSSKPSFHPFGAGWIYAAGYKVSLARGASREVDVKLFSLGLYLVLSSIILFPVVFSKRAAHKKNEGCSSICQGCISVA